MDNRIHQDIKPTNILVFGGNGTSPYDCRFKVADLGLTHFRPSISQPNDPSELDAFGTRAYSTRDSSSRLSNLADKCLGAPENFRSHVDTASSPLRITQAVDIWSIGCVFSEVSVWARHGWKRVVEYRRQRKVEIENRGGGKGEHIFHWDGNLLDAVNNIHHVILMNATAKDHITRSVLDCLVNDMLQHGARPTAKFVFEKSKRLIKKYEKDFEVSVVGLVGNTNGDMNDLDEVRTRNRSPRQVPHDYNHSRQEREPPLEEPLPPDDDSTPSSPSSRSQPSPHRHHHKSTSQTSQPRSIGAIGSGSPVSPNPPPPPSTAANIHDNSSQQHIQQHQEEPVRPTLSIDEGHIWKEKKKNLGNAVLPGDENLTSCNRRDHVSHILSRPKLADRWV